MKSRLNTTRWLGLVLAGSILTLAASGQAGKPVKPPKPPPGPPVDTGIIYAGIEGDLYAVNPDGSGQQFLFSLPTGVCRSDLVPSRHPHNGERWFVGWQKVEGTYPDGVSDRLRLIALSESGAVVPLHDDGTLQPAYFLPSQRWLPEDGAVSWLALRWEGEDIVEWGLYTLDLEFTADGPVASGTPTLLDWTAELFWYYGDGQGPVYLNVENYDWSPDGSAIVYSAHEEDAGTQLYVADSMGGPVQLTSEVDAYPATPRWSPDGTRIVFQLNGQHQIDVIDLAGAERYTLITTSRTDYREMVFLPMWSPASTHLVYSYCLMGPRAIWKKVSLHRIAADGSDDAPLTGAYNHAHALGWRAEE